MPADRMNHLWRSFVLESSKYSLQCIFQDSYHDLFQYGLRITANPEDVKDSIQDLFVSLWLYKNSLATEVNVKAYLLVSLKHQLSRIRSKLNLTCYQRTWSTSWNPRKWNKDWTPA